MNNLSINSLPASNMMQHRNWHARTLSQAQQSTLLPVYTSLPVHTAGSSATQLINEVDYDEDRPWPAQQQVLPLLRQAGQQSRWQLWLTSGEKLDRRWLQSAGLPINKILQVSQLHSSQIVDNMISALQTGNYSVVTGCLPLVAERKQYEKLLMAAQKGSAIALLIYPHAEAAHNREVIHNSEATQNISVLRDYYCRWYH